MPSRPERLRTKRPQAEIMVMDRAWVTRSVGLMWWGQGGRSSVGLKDHSLTGWWLLRPAGPKAFGT